MIDNEQNVMDEEQKVKIRRAVASDIDALVKLRVDFHLDGGKNWSQKEIEDMETKLREYFERNIRTKVFVAYFAELAGEVVSGAYLAASDRPPRKPYKSSIGGTVHNVYTYPHHRGNGYATLVMNALVEEAKEMGVAYIDLMATNAGKPLYDKLGFETPAYTPMRIEF